jgi:hypothetical protein
VTVKYADATSQTIQYKVVKPAAQVVADLGRFLTHEQWFEKPGDPFGRSPSVTSYDYDTRRQVTEDARAWIAGLVDEGGSGSWLAAIMKQLVQPDSAELARLQRFEQVLWGGLRPRGRRANTACGRACSTTSPTACRPGRTRTVSATAAG